ncbi:MAG: PH domain-containing protein [Candidatus Nanosalina sp.]
MVEDLDWLSLDDGEEVVWSGNPRMHSIIPAVLIGVPLIPLMGIGVLIMAGAYLSIKNTYFVVTSEGVYHKSGVLSRDVQKIGFDKIQNISYSQGVFGNFFGYGNVDISTAGGSGVEMRFRSIGDPKDVQQEINRRIKQDKGSSETEGRSQKEILEEILSEVKEINEKI